MSMRAARAPLLSSHAYPKLKTGNVCEEACVFPMQKCFVAVQQLAGLHCIELSRKLRYVFCF